MNKKPEEVDATDSGLPQFIQSWQRRREAQQAGVLLPTLQQQQEEAGRQAEHDENRACKQPVKSNSNFNQIHFIVSHVGFIYLLIGQH